jgi:hypothetical protein
LMRALPDIADAEAMRKRGVASALWSARTDAIGCLRDAYTAMQAADWIELQQHASIARDAADRLMKLADMAHGIDE